MKDSAKPAKVYSPKPSVARGATRREFLKISAGLAAGLATGVSWPVYARTDGKVRRSRTALVENPRVLTEIGIRKTTLTDMLEDGLCTCFGKKTPAEVWQGLLRKDDRILLKFNSSAAERLNTNEMMATVLIESIAGAGFDLRKIMLVEASSDADWARELPKVEWGWSEKTYDFGSGQEQLTKAVEQATAIINVPFLKAHRIAGMSGCLKNLSHGLIRRPARYHANGCCPYIADIVDMPAIRDKLRLHVMNALRLVYDAGPNVQRDPVEAAASLIVSADPVAADTIGQSVLDAVRQEKGFKPLAAELGAIPQHRLAAEKGLGINNIEYIDVVRPAAI